MSVCIAAICSLDKSTPKIFAICDKGRGFHRRWLAMFAGNDVSPCIPILRAVMMEIGPADSALTVETVKKAFEKCYQEYLANLATSRVLGRWKLSMEQFLETGRKKFGADSFDLLVSHIQQIKLECKFLVCGFEGPGIPHIFTVRNPGYVEDRTMPGYWAIGNGDSAAMSTLGFYQQSVIKSLGTTYYNVMAAKFMAEKATHEVGERSFFWQLGNDGEEKTNGGIEALIRNAWEKFGQPKSPSWFLQSLDETLQGKKSSDDLVQAISEKLGQPQ